MSPQPATQDSVTTVRDWADELLDRAHHAGPIPSAGSAAWSLLDDRDPRKAAAVVRAALAWLHSGTRDAITARVSGELDLLDRLHADRAKAVACDLAAAADWSRLAAGPTHRELIHRRHTSPCPQCRTPLTWPAAHCGCGWTEPTPAQIRDAARQSWARYDTTTEAAA